MARRDADDSKPLMIDRAAAAEIPAADKIREWSQDKRVFISSVMSELPAERAAAATAIRAVGARPIMFEQFGGRDADPEEAYLAEVETSDIYLGFWDAGTASHLPQGSRQHTQSIYTPKNTAFASARGRSKRTTAKDIRSRF